MKLLLDQNLSRNLLTALREVWPDTSHVIQEGLATASDQEIWEYSVARGYTIVSKDSDFRQLAFLHGPPPKVVWVRLGNVTTSAVLQALLHHRDAIEKVRATRGRGLARPARSPAGLAGGADQNVLRAARGMPSPSTGRARAS